MPILSILCFLGCVAIVAWSLRKQADPFSPARVFIFLWMLIIGLVQLKLSRLQHEWSTESWIVLLLGPASFLTGLFAVYVLNLNTPVVSLEKARKYWKMQRVDEGRLFVSVTVMFVLYMTAFLVIRYIKGVVPPLYSLQPGLSRYDFTMFGLGLFLHNVVIIVFFTVVYHLLVQGHSTRKHLLKLMSALAMLFYFMLLQRFQLILTAFMCVLLIYYATRHLRAATSGVYLGVAVGFFYWVSTLRSGIQFFILYLYETSRMKFPASYAILTEPYMYFAMNLENFARAIDKLDHHSYGYYTFDFIIALVGLKHGIHEYFRFDDTPYLISGYNTYTSYWIYLRDFGIIGVFLFPLLLGLLFGSIYYAMRRNPDVKNIAAYGLCLFVILFTFYNNPLGYLWYMYTVAAFVAILWFTRIRSAQ
jgi:oligosaccharide repeat unit polymerase